jgi:hypothetical protein
MACGRHRICRKRPTSPCFLRISGLSLLDERAFLLIELITHLNIDMMHVTGRSAFFPSQ